MIKRPQSISLIFLCASILLQGCQSLKRNLGIERDPPNEYIVTPSNQPLIMPPNFSSLPVPVPGMERPDDRAARQLQGQNFLGTPNLEEAFSPGQEALLDMCGVDGDQEYIRPEIDREAMKEVAQKKPIIEQLGIKTPEQKDIINPHKESVELQKQGIPPSPIQQLMPPLAERPTHPKPPKFDHEPNIPPCAR